MTDDEGYRAASRSLWHGRLRTSIACFLLFAIVATGLDMTVFPERVLPLLATFTAYVFGCLMACTAARRWPRQVYLITVASALGLIPCIAAYHVAVGTPRELLLMPLGLYLCATTALLPWGGWGQGTACATVLLVELVASGLGMPGLLPLAYTIGGVLAISCVVVPCADWFERLRYAAWIDGLRARQAEAALTKMEQAVSGMRDLAVTGPTRDR